MRSRKRLALFAVAAAVGLGGCATPLYELEPEEEDLIISYSAYAVAKHNVFQKDGYVPVRMEEESPKTPENESDPAGTDPGGTQGTGGQQDPENTQPAMQQVSFAEVLGQSNDVDAIYKGAEVMNSYEERDANGRLFFIQDPDPGKVLLVLRVRLINSSESTIQIDVQKTAPEFLCCYNGRDTVEEKKSIALKALSTYRGQIGPEKSADTVILFQIPESEAENLSDPDLQIRQNDVIKSIKL